MIHHEDRALFTFLKNDRACFGCFAILIGVLWAVAQREKSGFKKPEMKSKHYNNRRLTEEKPWQP